MTANPPYRDERTIAVENAGYRWAYLFLSFGLLLAVAYRSFVLKQQSWDLLALVFVGGAVGTLYQASHRVLTRPWLMTAVVTVIIAVLVSAAAAWLSP